MEFPNLSLRWRLIIYKLLGDALWILLLFFVLALVVDAVVPGLVSDHVSFLRLTVLLAFILLGMDRLARRLDLPKTGSDNKKTTILLVIVAVLLIFNSLFKISIYPAVILSLASLLIFYFSFKLIFKK